MTRICIYHITIPHLLIKRLGRKRHLQKTSLERQSKGVADIRLRLQDYPLPLADIRSALGGAMVTVSLPPRRCPGSGM